MKTYKSHILFFGGVLLVVASIIILYSVFVRNVLAESEVIPNQLTKSVLGSKQFGDGTGVQAVQQLGTGYSGTLQSMTFYGFADSNNAVDTTHHIELWSISNANPTDMQRYQYEFATSSDASFSSDIKAAEVPVFFDGNVETNLYATDNFNVIIDPTRTYYLLYRSTGTQRDFTFYGIANFQYIGGDFNSEDTNISAAYMYFTGEIGNTDTSTRIIEQITPTHGSTTSSTTVAFQFRYYYGDTNDVDTAGYQLRSITSGYEYATPERPIIASGESTFTATSTLNSGEYHLWRAYLRDSVSGQIKFASEWKGFNVLTVNQFFPTSPPVFDPNAADATSSVLASIFGQQGYFANKFPFAYIYDVSGVLSTLSDSETETQFPTLTLALGTSTLALGDIEVFSSSTITQFAGSNAINIFRTIMESVLWLSFMAMIFFEVKHLFK